VVAVFCGLPRKEGVARNYDGRTKGCGFKHTGQQDGAVDAVGRLMGDELAGGSRMR